MTSSRTLPVIAPASLHEHAWLTESTHRTSEGLLRYVRCTRCCARRVDIDAASVVPPSALTREIG
ncbi:hypothetical protein QE418_001990 [Microbacterium testaceum]|uniref:hypothetical protein n=1 Tax=Microbacterium TaxID=33882 RepID=UPI001AE61ACA|nr:MULTISPECIES: hypothetical protein [Microbacterium]MDQ1112542.1 hypothetical protein [Microbacterium testaceum]MDQ1176646.1 hypothetical protein [Microbacterium sp. SORGH_AS_0421]MDR6096921.1 hypothetical protein [Microbacterium sp. SORGH_AS_0454]WAC70533.1 hypothetical protein OVA17_07500 [Microbacterium sp. SL75]